MNRMKNRIFANPAMSEGTITIDQMTQGYHPTSFDRPKTIPVWFFLDDEREPPSKPDTHWVIFRNGETMIELISRWGLPDGISFDHDLGLNIMTGHDVAKKLVDMVLDSKLTIPDYFQFKIHSANPVGAKHIELTMNDLLRLRSITLV